MRFSEIDYRVLQVYDGLCAFMVLFCFLLCFAHSQAIKMKRWNNFVAKLALDKRVDFEEGDIGLPGGAPRRMRMEELTLNGVRMQIP